MPEQSRLVIPARLQDVRNACDFVVEAAESAGLDERAVYHCQMAVDEALTNIIEHGFDYHGENAPIEIACQPDTEFFQIAIIDTSPAFNPLEHESPDPTEPLDSREPGGWGIYFIRRLMDDITYERLDDRNRLTMFKRLPTDRPVSTAAEDGDTFPTRILDRAAVVISPEGRLDSNSSLLLEKTLMAQLGAGHTWLFIDMENVEYIASSGLKVLVAAWRRAREAGGDVILSGLQPRIVEIFEMVGFDMLFQVFPTLPAALDARSSST